MIQLASCLHEYGAALPDQATAESFARQMAAISVNPRNIGTFGPAMKAANPKLRLVQYMNGMFAQSSEGSKYPSGWYMRAADGSKIQSKGYGNYLMNPNGAGSYGGVNTWADYVASRVAALTAPYDGAFLDMLGSAPLSSGYNLNNEVPINPETGQPFTITEYYALTAAVGAKCNAIKPCVGNGLGNGSRYAQASSELFTGLKTAMPEIWLRQNGVGASNIVFEDLAHWTADVQMLIDAAAGGDHVWALCKAWGPNDPTQLRTYAWATFVLGNSIANHYLNVNVSQTTPPWQQPVGGFPTLGYAIDTFAHVGDYQIAPGVFQRRFSKHTVQITPASGLVKVI